MELHQLRYFVAVADTGSFTQAAERCSVSQPSLSQAVRKLEAELEQTLFERLPRGARLTAAGWALYDRAVGILADLEQARHAVRDASAAGRDPLAFGVIPTVAPYLLPVLLQAFRGAWPNTPFVVHEDMTAGLLDCTRNGRIELALAALPLDDPQLTVLPLHREPLRAALPASHPLAARSRVELSDLEGDAFLYLTEGHCLGEAVDVYFADQVFKPRIQARLTQMTTVKQLVACNYGVAILPAMACHEDSSSGRCYLELGPGRPSRTLALFWRRDGLFSATARWLVDWFIANWGNVDGLDDPALTAALHRPD